VKFMCDLGQVRNCCLRVLHPTALKREILWFRVPSVYTLG